MTEEHRTKHSSFILPPSSFIRPSIIHRLYVHRVVLLLAIAVVAAAIVLQIGSSGQVVLPWVDVPLPTTCTFKRLFSIECPGCGLTRCFISMADGEWNRAWTFNPAGIALFCFVVGQIPYRVLQLWRLRRGLHEVRLHPYSVWVLILFAVALFLQWFVRVFLMGVVR